MTPPQTEHQMLIAFQVAPGYGAQPGAWRQPGVNLASNTEIDQFVNSAQAAERGKVQLLFFMDTPVLDVGLERESPHHAVDPSSS